MALTTPVSVLDESLNRIMGAPGVASAPQVAPVSYTSLPTGPAKDVFVTSNVAQPAAQPAPVVTPYIAPTAPVAAPSITPTAPAVATTPSASVLAAAYPGRTAAAAAPTETATISRQALADRQAKEQQDRYMASFNQQVSDLQASGLYRPDQLQFNTPTFASSGGNYGPGGGGMVANPYYVAPAVEPAPGLTPRAYAGELGITGAAWRGMARPEREQLRQQYITTAAQREAAANAAPNAAMTRVVGT